MRSKHLCQFVVLGSKGDEYRIRFDLDNGVLFTTCTCQAGPNGSYCKHRVSLLTGGVSDLASKNSHELALILPHLAGSRLKVALDEFTEAAEIHDTAKRRLDKAKKKLTDAMFNNRVADG
ncbi:MAG TPA: SWIM zinc finger family protein [Geminicoccus sp.]|jgi:uncharacterized Zn finger protein|uniref:SWIM zinc finger family protein n=1 Tax=Geminicoccus sp. TaxID=2024832 RepID=UPI002E2F9187|nr:SWIM zinc finger family protein [Geminicoccus sp.]HEX2526893.1 SWIM zinc finger family protein [Geminicoccus sp.]